MCTTLNVLSLEEKVKLQRSVITQNIKISKYPEGTTGN